MGPSDFRIQRQFFLIVLFLFVFFLSSVQAQNLKLKNSGVSFKIVELKKGSLADNKNTKTSGAGIAFYDFRQDDKLCKIWSYSTALGGGPSLISKLISGEAQSRIRGIHYKDFIIEADLPEGSKIRTSLLVGNECRGYINSVHYSQAYSNYYIKFNTGLLSERNLEDWDHPDLGKTLFLNNTYPALPDQWKADLSLNIAKESAQELISEGVEVGLEAAGVAASAIPVVGLAIDVGVKVVETAINVVNYVNDQNDLEFSISGTDIVQYNDLWFKVSTKEKRHVYRAYVNLDILTNAQKLILQDEGSAVIYADFYNHEPHYGDNDGKYIPVRGFGITSIDPSCTIADKVALPENYAVPIIDIAGLEIPDTGKPIPLNKPVTVQVKIAEKNKVGFKKPFKIKVSAPDSRQSFVINMDKKYGTEYRHSFNYVFDKPGDHEFIFAIDPDGELDKYVVTSLTRSLKVNVKAASDLEVKITDISGDNEINKEMIIKTRVTNVGTGVSPETTVGLGVGDSVLPEQKIKQLKPQESVDAIFKWTPKKAGAYDLICDVDFNAKIQEYSKENNRSRTQVNIQLPQHQWVIQENSFICVPDKPGAGETAKIYFTLKNKGRTSDTLGYDVFVDEKKIKYGSVEVAPGETKTVGNTSQDEITWKASGGRHVVKLVLDPLQRFSDFVRAAAAQELVIVPNIPMPAVEGVDLVLEQKEVHKEGDKLSFRVYNRGTKPWCCTDIYVYQYTPNREKPSLIQKLSRAFAPQSYENFSIPLPPNSGQSKFEIVVDPLKTIAEVDENNNTATYTFTGYQPYKPQTVEGRAKGPDLIVVGAANLDTPLEVGEKRQVEISIANQNLMDAGRVQVDYAFRNLDTQDRNPAHGYFKGKEILEGVRAEGKRSFSIDYPVVYPGNYELNVWIDQGHLVPETDEMNNSFRKYFTVGGEITAGSFFTGKNADLAIDNNVQVNNLKPNAGMQVTFKVTARNNSDIVIWGADLDMFINDKLEAGEPLGDFPAHSEKTLTFTNTFLASGDYTVKFIVDAKKAIPETNEENNTTTVNIEVKRGILGTGHSDVAVTGLSLSKTTCLQGELVTASASVKNIGQDTLRGVLATIGPNHKQPVYVKIIPILDPGQVVIISTTLPALIAGEHVIEARVDGPDAIKEDNEENNVQTVTLRVEPRTKEKAISEAAGVVVEKAGKVLENVDNWLRGLGKSKK